MTDFTEKVWQAVKKVPRGEVTTYGYIARKVGKPRAARAVGNALKRNLYRDMHLSKEVPCHRVVRTDGSLGGFARGTKEKLSLLKKEGIKIIDNRVDSKFIVN